MVYPNHEVIQNELDSLCKATTSDFSGIAWMDHHDGRIRWLYASGNRNEQFKRLALKPGRGLAGLVLKLGRPFVIDCGMEELERKRLQHDYSIMLVEQLHTAIALPIKIHDETRAVLLIGNRSDRCYEPNDIQLFSSLSARFEHLLQ
ncbi:MAG: GAF domain-containing protein [Paenibacillaceae bacterium]